MFAFLLIAIGLAMFSTLDSAISHVQERFDYYRSQNIAYHIHALGDGVKQFYFENPAQGLISPDLVASRPGFEYLNLHVNDVIQFETSSGISDSVWKFNRVALWFESPKSYLGKSDYLGASYNQCGTGDFYTAQSWCGNSNSLWLKIETRSDKAELIVAEKQRMQRTLQKFLRRYSDDRKFTTLASGSVVSLAGIVGYTGTAANCQGNFVFQGIPLSCDDFFNYWGIPIALNQISEDHIALVNRTGVLQSSGQIVRLAEEARLE
ncbi:hypothetical protein [Pseudomonas sp. NPDC096950]|uniref:hypothetical protein n=1 Tax=Pseudomonas sp. NPDC096950 TaxID=3364485 RepID=UPI00383AEC2D